MDSRTVERFSTIQERLETLQISDCHGLWNNKALKTTKMKLKYLKKKKLSRTGRNDQASMGEWKKTRERGREHEVKLTLFVLFIIHFPRMEYWLGDTPTVSDKLPYQQQCYETFARNENSYTTFFIPFSSKLTFCTSFLMICMWIWKMYRIDEIVRGIYKDFAQCRKNAKQTARIKRPVDENVRDKKRERERVKLMKVSEG